MRTENGENEREGVRSGLRHRIVEELNGRRETGDEELLEIIDRSIREMGNEIYLPLKERLWLRTSLFDSFRRLDILQELIDDQEVSEVMVNGAGSVFVERNGRMELWNRRFEGEEQLEDIIQQIVSRVNRTVNVASPIVDARLEDGSRVNVVLPPIALDGAAVTIRKFPEPITMEKLLGFGAVTEEAADFLRQVVESGYNLFISGGTNSGKTTFLNALSAYIPKRERVITIEDSAELQIRQIPNLVRLETRNANTEGEGEVTMSQLIRAALRMNPSRIIVRGAGEGGTGHAAGHEHRPRRFPVHRPWEQPQGHAQPVGDHGAYGGRTSACGHPQPDRLRPGSDHPSGAAAGWKPEGAANIRDWGKRQWKCGNLEPVPLRCGGGSAQTHRRAQKQGKTSCSRILPVRK